MGLFNNQIILVHGFYHYCAMEVIATVQNVSPTSDIIS